MTIEDEYEVEDDNEDDINDAYDVYDDDDEDDDDDDDDNGGGACDELGDLRFLVCFAGAKHFAQSHGCASQARALGQSPRLCTPASPEIPASPLSAFH